MVTLTWLWAVELACLKAAESQAVHLLYTRGMVSPGADYECVAVVHHPLQSTAAAENA